MKTFTESNICPHCGGRLISDPIVLTSNPPQYQAHCEKCGKVFHSYHMIGAIDLPEVPDGMWCINDEVAHSNKDYNDYTWSIDEDNRYIYK